jgi:phosphopantetheinyl transferase (holo-ACP synthase)
MGVKHRASAPGPHSLGHTDHGRIHTLPQLLPGVFVVFASAQAHSGAELCLTVKLLQALAQLDPVRHIPPDENTIHLHKSPLGQPRLLLGDEPGPSLSFSRGNGRLWAAMSSKGHVGIDVAYPREFAGDYPFARAFRPEELDYARIFDRSNLAQGAALIWSAKEASVKAIGVGFNRLDPLEVRVKVPQIKEQGFTFEVSAGNRPIAAWARAEGMGWLCLALASGGAKKIPANRRNSISK